VVPWLKQVTEMPTNIFNQQKKKERHIQMPSSNQNAAAAAGGHRCIVSADAIDDELKKSKLDRQRPLTSGLPTKQMANNKGLKMLFSNQNF